VAVGVRRHPRDGHEHGPHARLNDNRSGYIQFATPEFYSSKYPGGTHDINRTVAHEVGHLVFLPHTQSENKAQDPEAHDKADHTCLMAYNYNSLREFCGYCLLRLRGWDHTKLTGDPGRYNGARPKISITAPTSQNNVQINARGSQTLTVTNNGRGPLNLGKVALGGANADQFEIPAGDDHVSDQSIPAGGSATLDLVFKPSTGGDKAATLTLPSNDEDSPLVVSFNSAGQQPVLAQAAVAGFSGDFGNVAKETESDEKQLQLTNSGPMELAISKVELAGAFAGDFILSTKPADKLAANASSNVGLKFKAATTKANDGDWEKDAILRVVSNAKDSPLEVPLKGTVHLEARVAVQTPPPQSFGQVQVGKSSKASTVTLKSTGSSNLQIRVAPAGTDRGDFKVDNAPSPGKRIAHDQTATFDVIFEPLSAGAKTAQIKITHNGPANGGEILLDVGGTGLRPPTLGVGPAPQIPDTRVKTESAPVAFEIQNSGEVELKISAVTADNPREFLVKNFSRTLAPNARGEIQVAFKPSAAGLRTTGLTITSNDPQSPGAAGLRGTGTA
jgi:hypothetical protein